MKKIALVLVAAAIFAGSGIFAPRPAQADTNSTIAIAAAAIVGLLTFDALDHPYYINDYGQQCYVPDEVADYWFQNNYGGWYGPYRGDWWNNRQRFVAEWNRDYGYGRGGYGYRAPAPPVYNGYRGNVNYNRDYDRDNYNRSYNGGYSNGYNGGNNAGYNRGNNAAYNRGNWNNGGNNRWNNGGGNSRGSGAGNNGGNNGHDWHGGHGRDDGDHGH